MPEVKRERTPISMAAAAVELEFAVRGAAIPDLHQDMLALLLAQIAFETGSGASCDNRNIGNITTRDNSTHDFFRPAWFAVTEASSPNLKRLHELMLKGQAPRAFLSYKDFFDGFDDYVRELKTQFPSILNAARTGDAHATAAAIKSSRYTPDAPPTLGQTLDSLRKLFLAKGFFSSLPKGNPAPAPAGSSSPPASC